MSSTSVSPWEWGVFGALVVVMLATDLLAHRRTKHESRKGAYLWSAAWVGVGLAFAGFVALRHGSTAAQEYLGAWLIEKSLSLDNLFVFLVIFTSLGVPEDKQRRVLFWGILGALGFRALFIFLGLEALERWHWVMYVFGVLLLWAAVRVARSPPSDAPPEKNKLVLWLEKRLPVTRQLDGKRFFVREGGKWQATPLLLALVAIELSDVAFAIDSVPAAMSVSRNLFVVYTSNILAILGLRALYIALAKTVHELRYLHWGLAAVLAFAAGKMLLSHWVEVPPLPSVGIIVACIGASVWWSVRARRRAPGPTAPSDQGRAPPRGGPREEARA